MLWVRLELVNNFLEEISTVTTTLRSRGSFEINMLGDINIDLMTRNAKSRPYLETLKRLGLNNLIKKNIHIKQLNLGFSLLDHFITSNVDLYSTTGMIITNASDHFYIYTTRKKHKEEHPKSKFQGRAYSNVDKDKFNQDIVGHNLESVYNANSSNEAWMLRQGSWVYYINMRH